MKKHFKNRFRLTGSRQEFTCWFPGSRNVSGVCGCVQSGGGGGRFTQTDVSFFTLIDMNSAVVV